MREGDSTRINAARILIGLVLFFNLQAAIVFLVNPVAYTAGFELGGIVGEKTVQGMGILFLMWNVPYAFALVHPQRYRISLVQAIIMQAIGLIGESLLLFSLPEGHLALVSTLQRFILFDGSGLIALLAAWGIARSGFDRMVTTPAEK